METDLSLAERRIRRTTIAGVALLALIAAVVSFRHMHALCLRHGEDRLAAVLIPLAVDGLIVVASMLSCWPTGTAPAAASWPGACSWSAASPALARMWPWPSPV
ncbi:DUF2637 domain-containing protein [Microbispora bryophytorum]|uniref:DUF2637 domain-containing protein n=1 Tax=Microbispora bryophytorum TaxID=1460882 RepID=UPI0033D6EAD5